VNYSIPSEWLVEVSERSQARSATGDAGSRKWLSHRKQEEGTVQAAVKGMSQGAFRTGEPHGSYVSGDFKGRAGSREIKVPSCMGGTGNIARGINQGDEPKQRISVIGTLGDWLGQEKLGR